MPGKTVNKKVHYRSYSTEVIINGGYIKISNVMGKNTIGVNMISECGRNMMFNYIGKYFYLIDDKENVYKLKPDRIYGMGTFTNSSNNGVYDMMGCKVVKLKSIEPEVMRFKNVFSDHKKLEKDRIIPLIEDYNGAKFENDIEIDDFLYSHNLTSDWPEVDLIIGDYMLPDDYQSD